MSNLDKINLHFIQNEATPHNNQLIIDINKSNKFNLTLWYAREYSNVYKWNEDITHSIQPANIFGDKYPNILMAFKLVFSLKSTIFQTGWETSSSKLIIILCFLTRKRLNLWCDLPKIDPNEDIFKKSLRAIFYLVIKNTNIKIFCAGNMALEYFSNSLNINKNYLINLPVTIYHEQDQDLSLSKDLIRNKYQAFNEGLFISAGSRLIKDKGYDLLIKAIAELDVVIKNKIMLIIFGMGEEELNLRNEIKKYGLQKNIMIESWLDVADMRALVGSSDVFIHPARFDAYGAGTINAMSLGTPVIASNSSGSGPALIKDNFSGWLYDAEDVSKLSELISYCFNNQKHLDNISKNAKLAFMASDHNNLVDILSDNLI